MNRIFSGVQPTGNLHLGNYLGAIRNWVTLQADYECIYCVVDLHAITVAQDPADLASQHARGRGKSVWQPESTRRPGILVQSKPSQRSRRTRLDLQLRGTSWVAQPDDPVQGEGRQEPRECERWPLLPTPISWRRTSLSYKATHVPVGEDQKQHLELCRDIAQAFNSQYEVDFFPLTEPLILGEATRVMSLRDGTSKMSKSDDSDYTRINLTDSPDLIAKKIRRARTDPEPLPGTPEELESRPEAANLVGIFAALCNESNEDVCRRFDGAQFSTFKDELAELAIAELAPITTEMQRLMDDTAYVESVLSEGAERAGALAEPVVREVQKIVGFLTA